ncbi:hypothetical protein PSUM_11240 [Pseudomonas umsongensis]|uniref:Uncharacterized protein n=1 Tax=Pseudomonas umsongensis TaxID=198618 RepID=A0ABX4DVG4_9PSED|nr:hypothetical protein PSUM_11240 [Pseudomonas umsongensis]
MFQTGCSKGHAGQEARIVGASMLAMQVNDDAGYLAPRGALRFFASRLAPTGGCPFQGNLRLHATKPVSTLPSSPPDRLGMSPCICRACRRPCRAWCGSPGPGR